LLSVRLRGLLRVRRLTWPGVVLGVSLQTMPCVAQTASPVATVSFLNSIGVNLQVDQG
jgi:hypothetical protein